MIAVDIRGDLRPLHRAMVDIGAKQVPFAISLALNTLAKGVAADEVDLIDETFKTPTPFTEKAYRIEVATKAKPVARVAAKDIQAEYLKPYVVGGSRSLGGKRGMLAPRGVKLNQYGNLTKGTLARLKGKPNVFVGRVKTRKGKTISGLWQRQPARRTSKGSSPAGPLKLLIAFADTTPVPKRLPFEQRARAYLKRHTPEAFTEAMQRAQATARR